MDGFEVLRFHHIGVDPVIGVQPCRHVPHHVLHELRIVIGPLGDEFFIGPLEQSIEFARGLFFHQLDEFLDPDEAVDPGGDGHVRALVVGTPIGNLFGAGAEAGDRYLDLQGHGGLAPAELADEGDVVVHQALYAGDRCGLVDEIGKTHLDMARLGLQPLGHLHQDILERPDRDLPFVLIEDLHETGHVGALEVVGQIDIHVEVGDGVLFAAAAVTDAHRVADILDAHLVDGDAAGIRQALYIFHGSQLSV